MYVVNFVVKASVMVHPDYWTILNCEIMKDLNSVGFLSWEMYFVILDNA